MTGLELDHEHNDYIINFKEEYGKLKARVEGDEHARLNDNIQRIYDGSKKLVDSMYDGEEVEKEKRNKGKNVIVVIDIM